MKWIAIAALSAAAAYLFFTRRGKIIRDEIIDLATESKQLAHYIGNIAGDIKQQKLAYGEQAMPTASTH